MGSPLCWQPRRSPWRGVRENTRRRRAKRDEQADAETQAKLLAILGPDKVHLAPLIDQLLFMEESL